ncbi:hypothetical protein AB9T88_14965 [Flavobacterium sp. LBUM151]
MKNLQQRKIKKSDVLKVMLVFAFAAFFISCNNESGEDQNAQLSNTEQQNQPNTQRYLPHYEGVIVRNWGAHNIDCSQPEGFCIQILEENKDKLNQLADILIEKEVIFKDDLETIFGKRTFDKNLEEVVS